MAKKVLVIDDSAQSRQTLKSMLEAIPDVKSVSTAVDGVDGLRQALRLQPDLIMLDLEMPNTDGPRVSDGGSRISFEASAKICGAYPETP